MVSTPAQNEDQAKSPRSAQGEGIPHVSLTIHHLAPPRSQRDLSPAAEAHASRNEDACHEVRNVGKHDTIPSTRSAAHTSALQSLTRISYAVSFLQTNTTTPPPSQ